MEDRSNVSDVGPLDSGISRTPSRVEFKLPHGGIVRPQKSQLVGGAAGAETRNAAFGEDRGIQETNRSWMEYGANSNAVEQVGLSMRRFKRYRVDYVPPPPLASTRGSSSASGSQP